MWRHFYFVNSIVKLGQLVHKKGFVKTGVVGTVRSNQTPHSAGTLGTSYCIAKHVAEQIFVETDKCLKCDSIWCIVNCELLS